jgi:hypothetical protein
MSDEQRGGRARGQLSADDPSGTGPTIVGGQPPGAARQPLRDVPVGLEKVLYSAAIDPAFREALLRSDDRAGVVRDRGLKLQDSELAMLRLAPAEQLASAIGAIDTSETNLARRGFMRAVAGAVTLAAGSVLAGCGDDAQPAGIRPDDVSAGVRPSDLGPDLSPSRGIQPDLPHVFESGGIRPDDVGVPEGPMPAGIRPDDLK